MTKPVKFILRFALNSHRSILIQGEKIMNLTLTSIALLSCFVLLTALPSCAAERALQAPEILGENSNSGRDQFKVDR